MGKKTKKEKILAEYRRKLRVLEPVDAVPAVKPIQYQWKNQEKKAVPALGNRPESNQGNFTYVVSDLKRILFLTGLAICAQLVLWLTLGNRIAGL